MQLTHAQYADAFVLIPVGRIDQSTAPDFQSALLDVVGEGGACVVVDFSDVSYISSVGLRALMIAAKQAKAKNMAIAVAGLSPSVNEVFEISRFNFVVRIFDSVTAALGELSEDAASAYAAR